MLRPVIFLWALLLSCSLQANSSAQIFQQFYPYALFSDAAYGGIEKIKSAIHPYGFTLDYARALPGYEVAYFVASNSKTQQQIIAVRGTSSVDNMMINMAVRMLPDPHLSINLHEGFGATARAVYRDIKPYLKPQYTVSTTGHSLGGAIALILAMHLSVDGFAIERVITFGQPRLTNISGARRYAYLNIARLITERDMVPLLPPFNFVDMDQPDIYWHLGDEILLYPGEFYSRLSVMDSMLRAADMFVQTPQDNSIGQHTIGYYLQLIRQKMKRASFVPYKSPVNPLNWLF